MTSIRFYMCNACGESFIKTDDALFTRMGTKCPHCGSRRTKRVAESTIYEKSNSVLS